MRRRVLLVTGVCAVIALAGAGVAAATSFAPARPPATAFAAPAHDEPAPEPSGILEAVSGGTIDRATTFRYPGADYVKVHFSRLQLDPGDTVKVADATGTEVHRYSGAQLSDTDNWTMSVSGESATVSVERAGTDPLGIRSRLAGLGVTVDRVARGQTLRNARTPPRSARPRPPRSATRRASAGTTRSRTPSATSRPTPSRTPTPNRSHASSSTASSCAPPGGSARTTA